jgi:L-threonylcarbamoyladenylate synthase
VAEAVAVLRAGGLVGLPTETVYGLAARAFDEGAIARIFQAKGRPPHHPLIAHVLDERQARELAAGWPARASRLAAALWPGPLTLVVDRAAHVPASISGGGSSIAVRAPSHPVARAVLDALGEPVVAPSANRYQGLSPTTAAHVTKELGSSVDLILDAGPCEAGIESTVIDVRGAVARILRPGAIDVASLRTLMADVAMAVERAAGEQARASPGMEARHYAPRAALHLAATQKEAERTARAFAAGGKAVGLVVRGAGDPQGSSPLITGREMPPDPVRYAHLLYGVLHDLDDAGVEAIVVQRVPDNEAWAAVADRLERAAARKIVPGRD